MNTSTIARIAGNLLSGVALTTDTPNPVLVARAVAFARAIAVEAERTELEKREV